MNFSLQLTYSVVNQPPTITNPVLRQQIEKLFKFEGTIITGDYHPALFQRGQWVLASSAEEKKEMRTFAISLLYKWFLLQETNPNFSLKSNYFECLSTRWLRVEAYDSRNFDLVFGPNLELLDKIGQEKIKAGNWCNILGYLVIPWKAAKFIQQQVETVTMGSDQLETLQSELSRLIRELKY